VRRVRPSRNEVLQVLAGLIKIDVYG